MEVKDYVIESQSDETDSLRVFSENWWSDVSIWKVIMSCHQINFSHLQTIYIWLKRRSRCDMQIRQHTHQNFAPSTSCVHIGWHHKSRLGKKGIAIKRMKAILTRSTQDTLFDFHTIDKYAGLKLTLLILQEKSSFQTTRYGPLATNHCIVSVRSEEEKTEKTHVNYWQLLLFFY